MSDKKIRLQKFIADAGICSRRKAEDLIKSGKVQVSTNVHLRGGSFRLAKIGDKIDPENDIVKVDGKTIKPQDQFIYYAVNKPVGYTSTTQDPHAKRTVLDLVPKEPRVYPVGRLDKDSSGLMILTNDGELTNKLTHPRYRHEKEYLVKFSISNSPLRGGRQFSINDVIQKLRKGIRLSEGVAKCDKIEVDSIDKDRNIIILRVVLHQGWKRQIRRMCEKVGFYILELKRVRIGKSQLGDLQEGKYRIIKKSEII